MINAFDTEVAQDVGMAAAVLYKNIQYWCEKNRANGMNEHDGLFWTYNSLKAFRELFPYMSEKTIRRALEKLEENGYIKVGCFNEDARDRTRWYADLRPIINNMDEVKEEDSIFPKGQMSEPKRADTNSQKGEALPDNYQITTQITTKKESKKDISESARVKEPSFDSILESAPIVNDNPELLTAFKDFIKMRTRIKAPLTNRGLQLAINRAFSVARGNPELMTKCVEQSIERSWRGIFELTESRTEPPMPRPQRASSNPYTDMIEQMKAKGSEYL
ncbi:MAG: hypothetical protein IKU36_06265 [Bacteroidales bacterium]|nr:hypothetical protein [Bacteroidales bacterium]